MRKAGLDELLKPSGSDGTYILHSQKQPPAKFWNVPERSQRYGLSMAIIWSRIHASLGESPRELTFDLLQAAVDQRMVETDDLDWKSALPGKEEERLEEFAKDVAAMANTRGGLLVYGVEEERGKGSAKGFRSVDNSEGAQRRLRALANSRIHPRVAGLDLTPLEDPEGTYTILVLSVPRSPDAPHIIGQDAKLGIPYRDGPETRWMRDAISTGPTQTGTQGAIMNRPSLLSSSQKHPSS